MEPDKTVQAAIAHWSHRLVSNGVPLADFRPVVLNLIDDATHVANNRICKYRPQSADWMARQLGAA